MNKFGVSRLPSGEIVMNPYGGGEHNVIRAPSLKRGKNDEGLNNRVSCVKTVCVLARNGEKLERGLNLRPNLI